MSGMLGFLCHDSLRQWVSQAYVLQQGAHTMLCHVQGPMSATKRCAAAFMWMWAA